jgi:hypothetical protein
MQGQQLKVSVLIAIVVLVVFGGILYKTQIEQRSQSPQEHDQQNQPQPQVFKAVLEVNGYLSSGDWTRSTTTDLPEYSAYATYSVSNIGNADASSAKVTVRVDGEILLEQPISVLRPSGQFTDSFNLSMEYDSSSTVAIDASCSGSSDSTSFVVNANLLRSPNVPSNQELAELYITPNEVDVSSTEDSIISSKFPLLPNWIALRDWVGNNIDYKYDSEAHGRKEFWQLPHETLQLRTGDCEDFSILLCSLLRANGWSENDVYVVLGEQDGSYHAWVKINLGILGWYNIEPQADGWNTLIGDFLSLSGYDALGYFNDSQFHWTG